MPNSHQTHSPAVAELPSATSSHDAIARSYREVRQFTHKLCEPLQLEDYVVQSMPDASPAKWHLAHTTWFFETFVLAQALPDYCPFRAEYGYLFNSYYNTVGDRHPRPHRGLLTRPAVIEIEKYREYVDEHVLRLLELPIRDELAGVIVLGLHHEQQHQELILTDIKHAFWCNPLRPACCSPRAPLESGPHIPPRWSHYPEGMQTIGYLGDGFSYDNEGPPHQVFLHAFQLASRQVTNAEFRAFVEDGGYRRPDHWLSDGWDVVQSEGWETPFYWEKRDGQWWQFTLAGMRPLDEAAPVCHLSFYEADAFARWSGHRLPTEAEWEVAAQGQPVEGNFVEQGVYDPLPAPAHNAEHSPVHPLQLFGDVWEWTASPYAAYPGYRPPGGALGEYNGKFMCNQMVLRGGSCVTPRSHIRASYRNFFKPEARWQFTGIRLAESA